MKWLNPSTWSAAALRIAGAVLLVIGLHYIALPWYYAKEIKAETKAASIKSENQRLEREAKNNDKTLKAKDAQIKTLESIAADGKRLAAAADRLQHSLRASEAAKTELSACLQRADSLDSVQRAVGEFAGRVVQEADRHVSDKIACHATWPQ
jgi:wobble nucleotide-excising tRNase